MLTWHPLTLESIHYTPLELLICISEASLSTNSGVACKKRVWRARAHTHTKTRTKTKPSPVTMATRKVERVGPCTHGKSAIERTRGNAYLMRPPPPPHGPHTDRHTHRTSTLAGLFGSDPIRFHPSAGVLPSCGRELQAEPARQWQVRPARALASRSGRPRI